MRAISAGAAGSQRVRTPDMIGWSAASFGESLMPTKTLPITSQAASNSPAYQVGNVPQFHEDTLNHSQLLLDPNNYRYQDSADFVYADEKRFHEASVQDRAYRRLRG